MDIILIILLCLASIIILLLMLGLLIKKDYGTKCEIIIDKPKQVVFDYVKLLKNQDNYSKWATMDKNMRRTYTGVDGTPGFISAWESDNKNVGKGSQEITKIIGTDRIEYNLHFIEPFESKAFTYFDIETVNDKSTKVTWGFSSRMAYPFNVLRVIMNMEKMIAKDFMTGLQNMKAILEK